MQSILAVAVGGAIGSVGRFLLSSYISKQSNHFIPFGTLSVNIIGSFIIGVVWIWLESKQVSGQLTRQFVMIGLLGGFTTFSTFSLETIQLIHDSQWIAALANMAANLIACLAMVAIGIFVGKLLTA